MIEIFLSDFVILPDGEIGQVIDTSRAKQNLFIVEVDDLVAEYNGESLTVIDDDIFEVTDESY